MTNDTYGTTTQTRAAQGMRSFRTTAIHALVGMLAFTATQAAGAQGRGNARGNDNRVSSTQGIPPGHLPARGECRVWYDNRPPGQQPEPTSCDNARATAARLGGRVIYGDAVRRDDRGRDDDRRVDDRRKEKECDEKDRRKGKCGNDRGRDDERYPDRSERYPDGTYPRTLPEMVWGVVFGRGERMDEVRQWVGGEPVRATATDGDRNGMPEAVTWTDNNGRIVQRWFDDNRDGRADRVALYQNNKVVREIRP